MTFDGYIIQQFVKRIKVFLENFLKKIKLPSEGVGSFTRSWIPLIRNTVGAPFQHCLNEKPSHVWPTPHFAV